MSEERESASSSAASADAAPAAASQAPETTSYRAPTKLIHSPTLLPNLYRSLWFRRVGGFIRDVSFAVQQTAIDDVTVSHPVCARLIEWFNEAKGWVAEIPLVKQASRFGNLAYRTWHERMVTHSLQLMHDLIRRGTHTQTQRSGDADVEDTSSQLDERAQLLATELQGYFKEAFGNYTRIDYGTGHELTFVSFLTALLSAGLVTNSELKCLGLSVMNAYLQLVRELQTVYMLEPAGSKGAWGLDDYQFLPFLWGCAQFLGSTTVTAPSVVFNDREVRQAWTGRNLLVDAINFVEKVKTGPLEVHSPYLYSLSKVPTWERATKGLFKMYGGEVLSKFPVMQHVLFGGLLPIDEAPAEVVSSPPGTESDAKSDSTQQTMLGSGTPEPNHQLISLFAIPIEALQGTSPEGMMFTSTKMPESRMPGR